MTIPCKPEASLVIEANALYVLNMKSQGSITWSPNWKNQGLHWYPIVLFSSQYSPQLIRWYTDMPWTKAILKQFSLVYHFTTEESDWYGPFNTLLFELFSALEHYQITPQYNCVKGSQDFTVHYIIHKRHVPIFFVELKMYGLLKNHSAWALTNDQMHNCFHEFSSGSIPMPKLVGISSFGTWFCVYTFTTKTRILELNLIVVDAHITNDIAPEDRWAFDLLSDKGEAKLREVVTAVKAMAVNFKNKSWKLWYMEMFMPPWIVKVSFIARFCNKSHSTCTLYLPWNANLKLKLWQYKMIGVAASPHLF